MPAAAEPPEAKSERDELLWQALKEHIMLERQKKKEEQEAEVEEERLRKEREARDRQDAMTLGETREQITLLNTKLEELRNEKQQLFLRLKKVLNEDENRKKQQLQKESEMFALQNIVQQGGAHPQIFLPPRAPHQQMQKGGPPMSNQQIKRSRSPSPVQGYWKTNPKHEDGKRVNEVTRAVLWNKPTYQNPSGNIYYPNPQDSRGPSIIYPAYPPNLSMPIRQAYQVEMPPQSQQPPSQQQQQQQQQQSNQMQQHMKVDSKANQPAQVYHINLDQPSPQQQQQQMQQQQHKVHSQQQGPPPDRGGYHMEIKHDDRKDARMMVQQQTHPSQQQQSGHIMSDQGIVYTQMRPGMPPMHSTVMTLPQQSQSQQGKPGGSISQGYPIRGQLPPQQQQQQQQQQPGQPPQQPPILYRHRY